jgi:hypothetical protein
MDATWSNTDWQLEYFNNRQLISLLISIAIISALLLIPIKLTQIYQNQETFIAIDLVKAKPLEEPVETIPEQVPQQAPKENPEVIERVKPIEPSIQPTAKPLVKPQITVIKTKEISKLELPSAGEILNSIDTMRDMIELDEDFQVAIDDANDFKFKTLVKPQKILIDMNDKRMTTTVSANKAPMPTRLLKATINYLFMPIPDKEKTQDHQGYCSLLGRNSIFCPDENPLH